MKNLIYGRICVSCGKEIPPNRRKDAKKCSNNCDAIARVKKSRLNNIEQYRNVWRKYYSTELGLITSLLNNARDRAKRYNREFDLDKEFIIEKLKSGKCELTQIPFNRTIVGPYKANPYAPSLDRIDSKRGYTKDNVRLICFGVNRALSDWGLDILIHFSHELIKNNK